MTTVLAQRKYRLAGRLALEVLAGYGLWTVIAFAVLAAGSAVLRAATGGGEEEVSLFVFTVLPLLMAAFGWVYLDRTYPAAIANGMTRREFNTAYALFGGALVLAAAVFTQVAMLVLRLTHGASWVDLLTRLDSGDYVYGLALGESIVRPALYFACGAAVGAFRYRFNNGSIGAVFGALALATVLFRGLAYYAGIKLLGMENASVDGAVFAYPNADVDALTPYLDTVLAVLFVLLAWTLLARAPMLPKKA